MADKKVFVITKYVLAETAEQAIRLEKGKPVQAVWLEENSLKEHVFVLLKNKKK